MTRFVRGKLSCVSGIMKAINRVGPDFAPFETQLLIIHTPPRLLFEKRPAAFFSRAKTASTVGTLVFFIALFPYFAISGDDVSAGSRRAGCLLPPTCLALGTVAFSEFEDSGEVSVGLRVPLIRSFLPMVPVTRHSP